MERRDPSVANQDRRAQFDAKSQTSMTLADVEERQTKIDASLRRQERISQILFATHVH